MSSRSQYVSMIWIYKSRRLGLTKKIAQWQNEIRRIDLRNSKQEKLKNCINEYFQVDIASRKMDEKHKMARNVYYKYGMENGFEGSFLCKAIGRTKTKIAAECRLRFTRSFKTNKTNKETYHKFTSYMLKNYD